MIKHFSATFAAGCLVVATSPIVHAVLPPVISGIQLALATSDINSADPAQVTSQSGVYYLKDWVDPLTGSHATQSTSTSQPILLPKAANGWPVIQFDGKDDFLTTTLSQAVGDKSIFIVHKRFDNTVRTELSSSTNTSGLFFSNATSFTGEAVGRLNVAHDLQVRSPQNAFVLKSFIRNGPTTTLRTNDALATASFPDAAAGFYTLSGPSYAYSGQIAEVLIYNRALSDSERRATETYLNAKYGLVDQPPPVATGLRLRLAGSAVNTNDYTQVLAGGSSYFVKRWMDTSGNGLIGLQVTTGRQPLYVPNALNGQPVLQFDGIDDTLSTTLPQISGNKSIFVVQRRVDTASRAEIASTTSGAGHFLGNAKGGDEAMGRNAKADVSLPGLLNSFVIKNFVRNGNISSLYVNDSITTATVADSASGNYSISGSTSGFFAGQIAEILIYDRALNTLERQAVENYLSEKYALWEVSLPTRNGVKLWLSADAINPTTTYQQAQVRAASGKTYVLDWLDRSEGGFHATQTATDKQPLYLPNEWRGRPMLQFDGANDFLTTTLAQISGDKSLFVVHQRTATWTGKEISSSVTNGGHFLGSSSTMESKGRIGVANDLQLPWLLNQYLTKSFIRRNGNDTLRVNSSVSSGNFADSASGNYLISDSRCPFPGNIAEVIAYNRAVSDNERIQIEDYLADKWSYPTNEIASISPDLEPPLVTNGTPSAGLRVKQTTAEYVGSNAYHALYLPSDWQPNGKYPVIVEYAANGGYTDWAGFSTTGNVEDCEMGYGLSAGKGFIWISMPTIGGSPLTNQTIWWGDVAATKDYCLKTLRHVCETYGGDPSACFIAGFSRGGIACNYLGLNDDTMADVWLGFIPHSGYDGQFDGSYVEGSSLAASARLPRLKGRAQFITFGGASQGSWEVSPQPYLTGTGVDLAQLVFRTIPFRNHRSSWTERPIQPRKAARAWLQQVIATKPGTHSIQGRVTSASGASLAGVRIQSGYTHFTFTDTNGNYSLDGIIDSTRFVSATLSGYVFADLAVTISGANQTNVNFAP